MVGRSCDVRTVLRRRLVSRRALGADRADLPVTVCDDSDAPARSEAGAPQGPIRASHRAYRIFRWPEDGRARWHASQVTDPARTLIDMLAVPALGGGIRHVSEMLANLLHDHPKEIGKLSSHASKLGVGAVYKRLGYLLQRDRPDQLELIEICRANLSAGYAKLDPALPADRLATAWRVWVPDSEMRELRS